MGWLASTGPDVVMVHLGTNDVWSNIAAEEIVGALESLVGDMRASNPAMKILVSPFPSSPLPFLLSFHSIRNGFVKGGLELGERVEGI